MTQTLFRRLTYFAAAAALVTAVSSASAHQLVYTADLSGPNEFPANASPGIGSATVTVDLDLITMRVQAQFSGLTGNTTASHIHGLTSAPFFQTAGVATQTPSFSGFPLGVTSGSMDTTFNMGLSSSYNAAFITNNGGTVGGAFNAFLTGLDQGRMYLNIHTSTFGGGEIRGFLVPEPASMGLVAGVPFVLARRRRA